MENSYVTTAVFNVLTEGTYYLAETDEAGNALNFGSEEIFFENEMTETTFTLTPKNPSASVEITNNIMNPPGGFLQEDDGELSINKSVLNGTQPENVNETFYFSLFADIELTQLVATESLTLDDASEGTVTFTQLPYGTYYIAETDEEGNLPDDSFAYEAEVDKESVTFHTENRQEEVAVKNIRKDSEQTETTSETEDETTKSTTKTTVRNTTTTASRGAKTNDSTPLMLYMVILLGAAVVFGGTVILRKHRQ